MTIAWSDPMGIATNTQMTNVQRVVEVVVLL